MSRLKLLKLSEFVSSSGSKFQTVERPIARRNWYQVLITVDRRARILKSDLWRQFMARVSQVVCVMGLMRAVDWTSFWTPRNTNQPNADTDILRTYSRSMLQQSPGCRGWWLEMGQYIKNIAIYRRFRYCNIIVIILCRRF